MAHTHLSIRDQLLLARFRQTGDGIRVRDASTHAEIERSVDELRHLNDTAKSCPHCNGSVVKLQENLELQRKETTAEKIAGRVRVVRRPGEFKAG